MPTIRHRCGFPIQQKRTDVIVYVHSFGVLYINYVTFCKDLYIFYVILFVNYVTYLRQCAYSMLHLCIFYVIVCHFKSPNKQMLERYLRRVGSLRRSEYVARYIQQNLNSSLNWNSLDPRWRTRREMEASKAARIHNHLNIFLA